MSSDGRTVYLAIKFHADHRNRELVDRISAVFEKHGLTTVCVARDFEQWGQVSFDAHDPMQRALGAIHRSAFIGSERDRIARGAGLIAAAHDLDSISAVHDPRYTFRAEGDIERRELLEITRSDDALVISGRAVRNAAPNKAQL
jgi:hypothetical protein